MKIYETYEAWMSDPAINATITTHFYQAARHRIQAHSCQRGAEDHENQALELIKEWEEQNKRH